MWTSSNWKHILTGKQQQPTKLEGTQCLVWAPHYLVLVLEYCGTHHASKLEESIPAKAEVRPVKKLLEEGVFVLSAANEIDITYIFIIYNGLKLNLSYQKLLCLEWATNQSGSHFWLLVVTSNA